VFTNLQDEDLGEFHETTARMILISVGNKVAKYKKKKKGGEYVPGYKRNTS
jgi:hypothetical protein